MASGSRKSLMVSVAVWIEYTSSTDGQKHRQTDGRRPTAITALTDLGVMGYYARYRQVHFAGL